MEINPTSGSIEKTYIYANSQIIAQHDGDHTAGRYFYMHDRLGSVRQIINTSAGVVKYYTYEPFGETIEHGGTFDNPFQFTGQFFDSEIDEYYLRARQYNPHINRFTTRDPLFGKCREPLTLHVYLYCLNDPVNNTDLTGESMLVDVMHSTGIRTFVFNMLTSKIRGKSWKESLYRGALARLLPFFRLLNDGERIHWRKK